MYKKKLSIREKIFKQLGSMRLIALSFLLVIFTGAVLLQMPFTNNGTPDRFINNLFMATSATCVTGLAPLIPFAQYNAWGHLVMIFLMQIGGLGLMTLISVILTLMKNKLFVSDKKIIQDTLSKSDFIDIPKFVKTIVKYTIVFEGIGFLLFSIRFVPQYGLWKGLYASLFLAVSAFCNAGFDNITMSNLIPYQGDALVSLTVCYLIITGGLGFVVWIDIRQQLENFFKKKMGFNKIMVQTHLHTKITVVMTFMLLLVGTLYIFIFESSNPLTLGPMDFKTRLLVSFFQSTTLRTAGFCTVDIGTLRPITQVLMSVWMFIGGSPGGCAGGIKTTTFAVIMLFTISLMKGEKHITIFSKDIATEALHKAFVVFMMYSLVLLGGVLILSVSEVHASFLAIVFEATSALATVGLSLGITPTLTDVGRIVIILLMYIGRVGPVTMLMSLTVKQSKTKAVTYAPGEVLIG